MLTNPIHHGQNNQANWLWAMFSALAYTLMRDLRELALANTKWASLSRYHSHQVAKDRGRCTAQPPAHSYPIGFSPSIARGLFRRYQPTRFSMTIKPCNPDTLSIRGRFTLNP